MDEMSNVAQSGKKKIRTAAMITMMEVVIISLRCPI